MREAEPVRRYSVGERVAVQGTFDGTWVDGFEVADRADDGGWRLRRRSDGSVLPTSFAAEDLRPES